MEKADEMGQVIVLYRLKEDNGIGWISNAEGITAKLGILEEAKMGMFAHIYGLDTQ